MRSRTLLLWIVTASAGIPIANSAYPGVNGKIAFNSNRPNNGIYVIDPSGSNEANFCNTAQPGIENSVPVWSPNGTQMVFVSQRDHLAAGIYEIYKINADCSNLTRLTFNGAQHFRTVWSPDGTKLAFTSDSSGNFDIWVMNADGTNPVQLTTSTGSDDAPSWSVTNKIAFGSNRDGNGEIYVMNADGSGQTRLTNNSTEDSYPAWSPDGTKIAFQSNRDGNDEIYLMNADGSGQTRLTSDPAGDYYPAWSPDGTKIVFSSTRAGYYDLYLMDANGSNQVRLTFDGAAEVLPDWQPVPGPSYGICLSYDPSKAAKSGSTIPIKLWLCDSSGNNLSSPSIVVHALSVTQVSTMISGDVIDTGNSNPDNDFRFDASLGGSGGYVFNLKTTGLATGSYYLSFKAGTDPTTHQAPFQVK